MFSWYGVSTCFKPHQTLHQILVAPKDRTKIKHQSQELFAKFHEGDATKFMLVKPREQYLFIYSFLFTNLGRLPNAQHCSPMVPRWPCSLENVGRHLYLQDWHEEGSQKKIHKAKNTMTTRHGSRGGEKGKGKKRGERERKEKKKKRGKRKRDIKKLRCHILFFCAYIGLH